MKIMICIWGFYTNIHFSCLIWNLLYCVATVYYFGGENENLLVYLVTYIYQYLSFFSWDWWRNSMKMDRSSWLCFLMEQEIYCILSLELFYELLYYNIWCTGTCIFILNYKYTLKLLFRKVKGYKHTGNDAVI